MLKLGCDGSTLAIMAFKYDRLLLMLIEKGADVTILDKKRQKYNRN